MSICAQIGRTYQLPSIPRCGARTSLIVDEPFFGWLLFRLKGRERRSIQTMATDGVSLFYNPDFVETLNAATLAGTLAHEVMHPALFIIMCVVPGAIRNGGTRPATSPSTPCSLTPDSRFPMACLHPRL